MIKPIIINDWKSGIAASPHEGMALLRNADVDSFPGALKVQPKTTSLFHDAYSQAFTADPNTEIMTSAGGTLPITGTACTVANSGGALPTGLAAATIYFIIKVTATTYKLATTLANAFAGTPINITGAGSGTNTMTSVDPGTINHIIINQRTNVFLYIAQDSNGRIWYYNPSGTQQFFLVPGNTLTNAAGNGIVLFYPSDNNSTFLFAFRNAAVDVMDVFGTTQLQAPSWSNSWKTLNSSSSSGNSHHTILGKDNIIYFCDGRYVGSIQETAADVFDPTDAASYTYNNQALDLPLNEVSQWLEEQDGNLMIAGGTFNKIYPWDRTSDSFNMPLEVPEVAVKRLKSIGGVVYILAGTKGNIYSTQGVYVNLEKKLPDYVVNNSGTLQSTIVTWGGIAAKNNALLFGAGVLTSGNSGAYLMVPKSSNRLTIDNVPASGSANVTAFAVQDEFYIMGYSGGAAKVDTTRYSSFQTVAHTGLYRVATKTAKGTLSNMEATIAKPASSGNIRIGYRTDTSSAFTTLDTYTADGTAISFETDTIGLTDLENIQFQVEADGDMEIVEIRFLP